jgi:hypothetical protein
MVKTGDDNMHGTFTALFFSYRPGETENMYIADTICAYAFSSTGTVPHVKACGFPIIQFRFV